MFLEPQPAKLTFSEKEVLVLGFLSNGKAIWVAVDGEMSITDDPITFPWRYDVARRLWVDSDADPKVFSTVDTDDKEG